MTLPFFWVALGLSLGILAATFEGVPTEGWVWGLALGIIPLWFLRARRVFCPLFIILLACSSALWAKLEARVPPDDVRNFTGPLKITLRGEVSALPEIKTRGEKTTVSLVLRAHSIIRKEGARRKFRKVKGEVQVFLLQSSVLPQVGDELRLYGLLSGPRIALNPGEFDYAEFLAQKNIHAVFQVIGKKSVCVVREGFRLSPDRILAETRRKLASMIDALYDAPHAAILKALVLGLRTDVSPDVRNQFMKTGTIHLLAISGMNITMIAGSFYLMLLFFGVGHRGTALLSVLIVIVYVGLAGAGLPVQRAGYASILVLAGILGGRSASLLNVLCVAFSAMLLISPGNLWSIGFQLSFLCVLSLIMVQPLFSRWNIWTLSLGSSLAVLLGTFPVVLYYFNIFSPVSMLANLLAIPIFDASLFLTLFALLFAGVPFLNSLWVQGTSAILGLGLHWIKHLSTWKWGYWFLERPSMLKLALYYVILGIILFIYRKVFIRKRMVLAILLVLWGMCLTSFIIHPEGSEFELTLLSGGKNQIAHAKFSNGAHWIVNAGRGFPSDQGEWLIAPFLRSRGIQRLEGVLLSDLSKRNAGGVVSLLRDFPAHFILHPGTMLRGAVRSLGYMHTMSRKTRTFQSGDEVIMGTERIRVLAVSSKGMAFGLESGPWRIVTVSQWDAALFSDLCKKFVGEEEVHAVFLPATDRRIPMEFQDWLDRARPLLVIAPDLTPEFSAYLKAHRIPAFDLKQTGAFSFKRKEFRLELSSFLKGSLGVCAYNLG